jgi:hypothetical protein
MTTDTQIKTRGRKKLPFSFPEGPFKVKDLAKELNISVPLVHLKMKEAGDRITKMSEDKIPGRKGRSAGLYQYTDVLMES